MTPPSATQPTPYSLQASCELSEDHFLTSDLVMVADDEVIPFVNPYTQMVEAIIFSHANSGTVYHLQRDPSATTGWTPVVLNLSGNVVNPTDVAVAGNGSAVYMLVFGSPDNQWDAPAWVTKLDSASQWDGGNIATYDDLGFTDLGIDPSTIGQFKGGIDRGGNCYFYGSATNTSIQRTYLFSWIATSAAEGNVNYQLLQSLDSSELTISDYIMLFDTTTSAHPVGYSLILTSDNYLNVYAEIPYSGQQTPQFGDSPLVDWGAENVTGLLWAWVTNESSGVPGYAYQTASKTWFVAGDSTPPQSVADQPAAVANSVAVWLGGQDVVNLIDSGAVLNTILQKPDGSWQAPIPTMRSVPGQSMQGLAGIFGVPTDPTQSTLFAIGLDESLSVLSLDESGWTQTLVRTDGTRLVEIDSYRAQISLLDANGVPVAGGQARIGTDRPVGFWQPSGGSFVTPSAPITLTADNKGEITFSVPAEELDCAVLTAQALDSHGNATGSPLTITTDYDVRGFLQGTGTLTDIGPLTGKALLQAKNSTGGDLFPGLTGLTGDAQTAALTGTTTALTQFMVAGQNVTVKPGPTDVSMVQLTMNGNVPLVKPTTGPAGYASGDLDLTLSIGHLFDTIGHALRHGVAKLASLTVQWSDEVTGWVVSLGAEIAGAVQNFAGLVITDIKDAFHAVGGFFQALGADIVEGLQWLKHNVLDLLNAVRTNAANVATFIGSAPAAFAAQVKKLDFSVNNIFIGLEGDTTALIDKGYTAVTGMTLGSPAPQPTPSAPGDTGSTSSQSKLLKDVGEVSKVINDAPGKWLLDKITKDVPPVVSLGMPTLPQPNYETPLEDLADAWNNASTVVSDLLGTMESFTSLFGQTRQSALAADLTKLFTDLNGAAVNFLEFCDDVANFVLDVAIQALEDFATFFTKQFKIVSSTSLLGQLLDLVDININMSLSEITGLIVAFPATLVSEIVGNGNALPALPALPVESSDVTPYQSALGGESDTVKLWLGILGGTTQVIWGLADIIGDLQTFAGEDGSRGEQSGAIDIIDIVAPIFESGFLFPLPLDQKLEKQLVPPIIFTALLPSIFGILSLTSWPKLAGKISQLPDGVGDVLTDYVGPFIQAFAGAANTALGVAFQLENDDTVPTDIAGTVLGNLSFMLAVFGTLWLNATAEDVPVLVKMVVDAIGNVGAGICIYESTSLPPK
jgi:hypothetical protein